MARAACLLVLAVLAGCRDESVDPRPPSAAVNASPGTAPAVRPVESFRLATFNINWGNAALPLVLDAIRQASADLVLLQETTPESEAYLASRLRATYRHLLVRGHEGRYAAERFGILSRFPVREVRFVPPEHGLFGFVLARAVLGNREVQIVNVHFQPFDLSPDGGLRALLSRARAAEETHVHELEQVLASLEPDVPTVIGGDFNSLSWFAAPARLKDLGYTDSFAAVNAEPEQHPTLRWPVGQGTFKLRIDYIFHDASFATRASRVICNGASDHCVVVSELRIRGANGKRPSEE